MIGVIICLQTPIFIFSTRQNIRTPAHILFQNRYKTNLTFTQAKYHQTNYKVASFIYVP